MQPFYNPLLDALWFLRSQSSSTSGRVAELELIVQSADVEISRLKAQIHALQVSSFPLIFYLFFIFWGTLFLRKLYLKNFNIKNKDNKISQGRGKKIFVCPLIALQCHVWEQTSHNVISRAVTNAYILFECIDFFYTIDILCLGTS